MNIGLVIVGNVIVDDKTDAFNIKTARGDVLIAQAVCMPGAMAATSWRSGAMPDAGARARGAGPVKGRAAASGKSRIDSAAASRAGNNHPWRECGE